jgi:hypothetical protein
MKKALIGAIAAIALFSAATANAASFPTGFVLDTATSNLGISIKALEGLINVTIPIKFSSGNWDTTIEQTGTAPPAVSLSSLDGALNIVDVTQNTKILGQDASFSTKAVVMSIDAGGPFPNNGNNPGVIDLTGLPMGLTAGAIDYDIKAFKLTGALNFTEDPVNFDLPAGSTANINETGGPGSYNVTLSIPVSVVSTITTDVVDLQVTVAGVLNFTAIKAIPEPGSIALFGIGLLGVGIPAVKRIRRKN